jgi:hypothetical protein
LEATITPTSIHSKIIILVTQPVANINDNIGALRIMRGATPIYTPSTASFGVITNGGDSGSAVVASLQYIDQPETTSAVTYSTQGLTNKASKFYSNAGTDGRGADNLVNGTSLIYLLELLDS